MIERAEESERDRKRTTKQSWTTRAHGRMGRRRDEAIAPLDARDEVGEKNSTGRSRWTDENGTVTERIASCSDRVYRSSDSEVDTMRAPTKVSTFWLPAELRLCIGPDDIDNEMIDLLD
jgi:hypothetical protein